MSINNLLERPIPPQPKGWGLLGQLVELWTKPGDVVLSPFAGIGSEGFEAVKAGRKFIGMELKESYYKQACKNLKRAEHEAQKPPQASLFTFEDEKETA